MIKGPARTIKAARRLRREMSLPEILLWQALRQRPGSLKFRRQHPAGRYVLDFFCSEAQLAIEIDGEAHDRGDRPQRDGARDQWLADHGVVTLRMPAAEVLKDLDRVTAYIVSEARARLPLHHPSFDRLRTGGPPPRAAPGED